MNLMEDIFNIALFHRGGLRYPPNQAELLQWLTGEVYYNSNTQAWEFLDSMGKSDRPIQEGRCYNFTVGNSIAIDISLANQDITYFNGTTEQTLTLDAAGSIVGYTGKFGQAYIKDVDGKYLHKWNCTEQASNKMLDSVGGLHGTIQNFDPVTFHASDNSFDSELNNLGYSIQDDNHTLPDYETGVFYPIKLDEDGNSTGVDIFGNTPSFVSRVKYNSKATNSNCVEFDGVESRVVFSGLDLGNTTSFDVTLVCRKDNTTDEIRFENYKNNTTRISFGWSGSNDITLTLGINDVFSTAKCSLPDLGKFHTIRAVYNGNGISNADKVKLYLNGVEQAVTFVFNDFPASMPEFGDFILGRIVAGTVPCKGIVSYMKVNDHEYTFATGGGSTVYDKNPNNPINGTIQNANLDTFWTTDNQRPHNYLDGFDLWQNDSDSSFIRIPFDTDGNSIRTGGDVVSGYTWVSKNPSGEFHNNAETTMTDYPSPAMITADKPQEYLFNTSETPQDIGYDDLVYDVQDKHITFCDVSTPNEYKNRITYEVAQSDQNLINILKYVNAIQRLVSADGYTLVSNDGYTLYARRS